MRLAAAVGIEIPPVGLIRLKDGALTYIIKRFDRLDDGTKLPVEDFCQLALKPLREKYEGSAELCVRILKTFATEPLLEISRLFTLLLFGWWSANGDMHLKNFSLLTLPDATRRLSPAYDLACTRLVIPDDDGLALPLGGRKKKLTRRHWLEFGEYCQIPRKAVERIVASQRGALDASIEAIGALLAAAKEENRIREYSPRAHRGARRLKWGLRPTYNRPRPAKPVDGAAHRRYRREYGCGRPTSESRCVAKRWRRSWRA